MSGTTVTSWSLAQVLMALAGSSALGAFITETLRKFRSKEDKAALAAVAARDHAHGEAAVIASMATAFTGTTGALRDEIERMQVMLNELRSRVVQAEAELRAAADREAALERIVADQKAQLSVSHDNVVRLRGERQDFLDRTIQQEGEIRQLNAIAEAAKRVKP